jgi:hypothetical protein
MVAFLVLSLSRLLVGTNSPAPLAPNRVVASLLPDSCQVYFEGAGLDALLRTDDPHPWVTAVREAQILRALRGEERSPERILARAETWLGRPLVPLVADLTRRGLGVGFVPSSQAFVLASVASHEDAARRGLLSLLEAIEHRFGLAGALRNAHAHWEDADVWFLGEDLVIARRGELLIASNERELVKSSLRLAADPAGRGMLDRQGFQEHRDARSTGAPLWGWIDMAALDPLGDEGFKELRRAATTPAAQILLGAMLSDLCGARALSFDLSLDGVETQFSVRTLQDSTVPALSVGSRPGQLPAEVGGPNCATALLYRDYAHLLGQRAELFPSGAQSGFAETITTGALLFEGRDLGTEVFPHLSPWLRLVARPIEFAPERRPEIPLPGLAVVGLLDDPREGEAWTTALQTVIAFMNIEQAQQGKPSLRLQCSSVDGIEMTSARLPIPPSGDGVDIRYNLEPAIAAVGRHLIVGTHPSIVRDLAQELVGLDPLETTAKESLQLDPAQFAMVLAANRAALVAQRMVSGGLEPEVAAREIEGLGLALASMASIELEAKIGANALEIVLVVSLAQTAER